MNISWFKLLIKSSLTLYFLICVQRVKMTTMVNLTMLQDKSCQNDQKVTYKKKICTGQRVDLAIFKTEAILANLLTKILFLNADHWMIVEKKYQQSVWRFVLNFGHVLVSQKRAKSWLARITCRQDLLLDQYISWVQVYKMYLTEPLIDIVIFLATLNLEIS